LRTKSITRLASLSDDDLFDELSKGFGYTLSNSQRIYSDANALDNGSRGSAILSILSEEEAAKALILVDAARCPRDEPKKLSEHLKRYYKHLAKGIYAAACYWAPETFGDLIKYIDSERQKYYLDGPNDIDWIFWNRILANREQAIYVDYIETDDGCGWLVPPAEEIWAPYPNMALSVAQALNVVGLSNGRGFKILAEHWRHLTIDDSFHYMDLRKHIWKMAEKLHDAGLVNELTDADQRAILDHWSFPLHSVDVGLSGIDNRSELRDIQKRFHEM
jgi:AbiV family abortive infection protein